MSTKTKLPKPPSPRSCTIGEMLDWAKSLPESSEIRSKKIRDMKVEALNQVHLEPIREGQWSRRGSLSKALSGVSALPHIERLEIKGQQIGSYVSSEEIPAMREVAKLLGKRLEHIDFNYFTMPLR